MTLRFFATWKHEKVGTATLAFTDSLGAHTASVSTGRHSHIGLTEVLSENGSTSNIATKFADALETAMNAASAAGYTVTFNESTLAYTITKASTTYTIDTGTNALMSKILGLTPTAHSAAISFTSDIRPHYLIDVYVGGRSYVSDDYEPGGISFDAEADDGTSYGLSRKHSPVYEDFKIAAESKHATFAKFGYGYNPITLTSTITSGVSTSFTADGATPIPVGANIYNTSATNIFSGFTVSSVGGSDSDASSVTMGGVASTGAASSATLYAGFSTVGWTYQHLFKHCRTDEYFSMHDGRERKLLRLRASGASFLPERMTADYDDQWIIPFQTRVVGRY